MLRKFTSHFESHPRRVALALLFSAVVALPVNAAESWKLNIAKSRLGPGTNTLVLDRYTGKLDADPSGSSAATNFLVISNGKIFVANGATHEAFTDKALTVDYGRLRNMKVVEIGDNVRNADHCGFRCQGGLSTNHVTLTFTAKDGLDPTGMMNDSVVLNTR